MGKNYDAWKIRVEDFDTYTNEKDKLIFLVSLAILAPSSHNSQPWKFTVGDKRIILEPDFTRSLSYSDPNNRQLFLSLGCALENLLIAADYFGYSTSVECEGEKIQISMTIKTKVKSPDHLVHFIPKRVVHRLPFRSDKIPDDFIIKMKGISALYNVELSCVVDNRRELIADIILGATMSAMESSDFRRELSAYVRHNLTAEYTGMPCFGMGIPTPISFIAPHMLKYFNMAKTSKKEDRVLLIKHTPAFVVLSSEDEQSAWIRVGRAYEHIALEGMKQSLSASPLAAPVQIGNYYQDLQNIVDIKKRPQMFLRLGYPLTTTRHSPRLFVQDVTKII